MTTYRPPQKSSKISSRLLLLEPYRTAEKDSFAGNVRGNYQTWVKLIGLTETTLTGLKRLNWALFVTIQT